jgi:hypothetical protein
MNIYKKSYKAIGEFVTALGSKPELLKEFKAWCQYVIERESVF